MATEKRLIDANRIVEVAQKAYNAWNLANATADGKREINRVYKMMELCKAVKAVADDCPTVDAVEVVRCKDCKHYVVPQGVPCCDCFYGLGFPNKSGNDFCSYGERRTDGNS